MRVNKIAIRTLKSKRFTYNLFELNEISLRLNSYQKKSKKNKIPNTAQQSTDSTITMAATNNRHQKLEQQVCISILNAIFLSGFCFSHFTDYNILMHFGFTFENNETQPNRTQFSLRLSGLIKFFSKLRN